VPQIAIVDHSGTGPTAKVAEAVVRGASTGEALGQRVAEAALR